MKDLNNYYKDFDNCLQHEDSFCSAACPFGLDVNTFISRLQEERFDAAYKAYRDATGFPFIAAQLCTHPCETACREHVACAAEGGGNCGGCGKQTDPIDLAGLEKATLAYAKKIKPTSYNLPAKKKSIAIIGAGISGLACALRLATKRYSVTVFEKTDHIGGTVLNIVKRDLALKDIELQMQFLKYDLKLNSEITDLERLCAGDEGFDAIYVATGSGGNSFGINTSIDYAGITGETDEENAPCLSIRDTGVFLGGELLGLKPDRALADGLRMATAIDNFLLTGNLKYPVFAGSEIQIDETRHITDESTGKSGASSVEDILNPEMITDADLLFSREEAVSEAKRCMKCQCNSCMLHCDLTAYVHKWPLRLKDEVIATTAPGKSELHATPAVRLINSCTHCGLCGETCPEDIDMDGMLQAARYRMHSLEKMPWAFNDFFLKDLAFTMSDSCFLSRNAPGTNASRYAFYPGCQLGASEPLLVEKTYEYLLSKEPQTGLMLGCCGVPLVWAGDEEGHLAHIEKLRADWEALGKPILILACPTCRNNFSEFLPEIETVFLYDIMAEWGLEDILSKGNEAAYSREKSQQSFAVFDPCATRSDDKVRTSVRRLCGEMGIELSPLPLQEKWTACCSYGGHGKIADPGFAEFVQEKRIAESPLPYITYCINCRDAFIGRGKTAPHLLNLIFGIEPGLCTVTERRENRALLKGRLMESFWKEEAPMYEIAGFASAETGTEKEAHIILQIDDDVRQRLSDDYILEQDAANVVAFCQRTGRTLYNTEKDTYTGYRKIGYMTYWVEYKTTDEPDSFILVNAYSHRMEIELEMVWNGEKQDIDM